MYFQRLGGHLCCRMFVALVLVYVFAVGSLSAQTPPISDRLPQNTIFYVQWRGKPFLGSADKKNHILQFLEDPDFDAVRQALAKDFLQQQLKDGSPAPRVQLSDLVSLLDNPAAAGFIANPTPPKSDSPGDSSHLGSLFLVYDLTGKTDLIQKLKTAAQAGNKEKPQITTYNFGGTSIEVRTEGSNANISYSARTPHYFLFANQKEVIEDLVTRFGSENKPATSVVQLPEYQAIHPYIGSDAAVEFFVHAPDLEKWAPTTLSGQQAAKLMRNAHLDKIHVAGGGMSFSGEALRTHGAVLGDASAGSLFDVAGASSAKFESQQIVSPGSYFSIQRFNFAALYQIVRDGVLGIATPQQSAGLMGAEAMAQGFLGMSITDAIQLFTGELASQGSFTADGESQQLYALTIQKPQDVLKILRATLSKSIAADDTSGDTTYLDLSFPSSDPTVGRGPHTFFYVAVTPQFIIEAPSKALLRQTVAQISGKTPAASGTSIFSNPDFLHLRALMPEKLSGISGADMSQIPWDKIIARWIQQSEQAAKQSNQKNPSSNEWLHAIKPAMINRHLHATVSGWWKDSNGIYFEYYAQ
jgi:hypothetical protein